MFTDYPLAERVLKALVHKGFTTPTAIQTAALPHSLEGKDILGQARTGTGKTLAFGLPIANRLESDRSKGRAPRAFILTPTRELALQVAAELSWVAAQLNVVAVYGGTGYGQQETALRRGCDIVVATPGRALDYLRRGVLNLSSIEIAVLDEADEMLSMGFEEDVETLLAATPKTRQTMLFSATLPRWAKKLASDHLRDSKHINLVSEEDVSYEEIAIEANLQNRLSVLSDILHAHHGEKAIIFTHTKAETDKLAKSLSSSGHTAEAIHGDLNQSQRERVISRFRAGQISALIGTNVAARGLDIPEVDLVVHYRIPSETESYQHRSGRTGRAGRKGTVVLLYGAKERRELTGLERAVSRRFKRADPPTPEAIQEAKLAGLIANASAKSPADKAQWQMVANDWIKRQDTDILAGLLAMVLGGAPTARSLLTGEEGWLTLRLEGVVRNVAQVVRFLKEAGAGELGRIQLTPEAAYADVRPELATGLKIKGLKVSKARVAPAKRPSQPKAKAKVKAGRPLNRLPWRGQRNAEAR